MKSYALVVNPVSGRGTAMRRARQVARRLEAEGFQVAIHETTGPGDATQWVSSHHEAHDTIVAVGGDGTLREVIEGVDGETVVGLVPAGTANVVSRDLGIPRSQRGALRVLASGAPRSFDVGSVNGRPFLAMVGIGLDGEIVRRLSERRGGPISMASYLRPGLGSLLDFRPERLAVEVDGARLEEPAFGVVMSNTRNYGGLFAVTPGARPDDGLLDYQVQRRPGRGALLCCALAAVLRHEAPPRFASYGRGRRFRVTSETPVAVQVDGDSFGTTPATVEVQGARVRILAPTGRAASGA